MRLRGADVFMTYRFDEQEHQRRTRHGLGAVQDMGVLDLLMNMPAGLPVVWPAIGSDDRRLLSELPSGVVRCDLIAVTREMVPAVTPLLATVQARDWKRGRDVASLFAVYCSRTVLLPEPPSDFELLEASLYGIGVTTGNPDEPTVLVPPEPFTDGSPTPAGWAFRESIYHQVRDLLPGGDRR